MSLGRQLAISTLVTGLLFTAGCSKKKPQLPPQAKAPADTVPIPLPNEISEATTPPPPQPEPQPQPPPPEPPKPKPQTHRKRKPAQTPPATTPSSNTNANTNAPSAPVAATAGTNTTIAAAHTPANPTEAAPDTAIAANVTSAELSQQKQTTAQLIESTEKTLTGLNRTLTHDEEEAVTQVRSYVAQSRKATSEGDFERAYNLATKAHLLSDALVKK